MWGKCLLLGPEDGAKTGSAVAVQAGCLMQRAYAFLSAHDHG